MPFKFEMTGAWKLRYKKGEMHEARIAERFRARLNIFMRRELLIMLEMVGVGWINQGIGTKWKPISMWTMARRAMTGIGGEKALIVSGEMHKSLTTQYNNRSFRGFVGILYQTKRKDGKSMVNIARLHEYGVPPYAIQVTPKMARYLAMLAKYLPPGMTQVRKRTKGGKGKGVIIISIPARPFFGPARAPFSAGIADRVKKAFAGGGGK